MESLQRISKLFDSLRNTFKNKDIGEDYDCSAKEDIQAIKAELVVLYKNGPLMQVRALAMGAYLALVTAKIISMPTTDKKNLLMTSYERLKLHAEKDECLFIFLRVQNLLCYYLIQLEQNDLCRNILESLEKLYGKITEGDCNRFIDTEELFTVKSLEEMKRIDPNKIDKVVTNNIQMLAFLYNIMNMPEKYLLYNHTALRRQVEIKEGTPQDWALRAARLGNYFGYLNQMGNARHHLCAAHHVLQTCYDRCKLLPNEYALQKADFEVHFLELSHQWVKYALSLFKVSKKNILRRYFHKTNPSTTDLWKSVDRVEEDVEHAESEKGDKDNIVMTNTSYVFPTLNLKEMEDKVPVELVTDGTGARKLFAFAHKWLMRAKRYYNFELQPVQYTSCALQLAELYEYLAFFERSVDSQYNIQKQRAEVLENVHSLLKSCDNMMAVQVDVIRELSQVQLELMALNLQRLWCEESHTNMINDVDDTINSLASSSNKTLARFEPSKSILMKKMEAAAVMNSQLQRLSGHISLSPSPLSFNC